MFCQSSRIGHGSFDCHAGLSFHSVTDTGLLTIIGRTNFCHLFRVSPTHYTDWQNDRDIWRRYLI